MMKSISMKHFRSIGIRVGIVVLASVAIMLGRPVWHISNAYWGDSDQRETLQEGTLDDASRLNATAMELVAVPSEREAAVEGIRQLLVKANQEGLKVSVAGARHSMGGHTLYPGGIALDMTEFNAMELIDEHTLRVGSGARWDQVIAYLDPQGKSVSVMQSNNSFSVGGSISVNCHGWQFGKPPIASTVQRFNLMLASGEVVSCSRSENEELFSLVLGGYGLFGVILEVDLTVVENVQYKKQRMVVNAEDAVTKFDDWICDGTSEMAYGRLNIMPEKLFGKVILTRYQKLSKAAGEIEERGTVGLKRAIFRGSEGDAFGKGFRWVSERYLQPLIDQNEISRNHLLNESVELYENRSEASTDILHEYFVPMDKVTAFMKEIGKSVLAEEADLLNVTLRHVEVDQTSYLRYADKPMIAVVMLFSQQRRSGGEIAMERLTTKLVDTSLRFNGRYYLPYRLHATPDQFVAAYPMSQRFFQLKRQYDPAEVFQNKFYQKYGMLSE